MGIGRHDTSASASTGRAATAALLCTRAPQPPVPPPAPHAGMLAGYWQCNDRAAMDGGRPDAPLINGCVALVGWARKTAAGLEFEVRPGACLGCHCPAACLPGSCLLGPSSDTLSTASRLGWSLSRRPTTTPQRCRGAARWAPTARCACACRRARQRGGWVDRQGLGCCCCRRRRWFDALPAHALLAPTHPSHLPTPPCLPNAFPPNQNLLEPGKQPDITYLVQATYRKSGKSADEARLPTAHRCRLSRAEPRLPRPAGRLAQSERCHSSPSACLRACRH